MIKERKKIYLIVLLIVFVSFYFLFLNNESEIGGSAFIDCLASSGIKIYGSKTCPACSALVESLGGYNNVNSIYVECSEEWEVCEQEMKTNYVPEIQINGEVYEGSRNTSFLSEITGCEI